MRRFRKPSLLYLLLVLGGIPIVLPFIWMLSTSLKLKENVGDSRLLPIAERTTLASTGEDVRVLLRGADGTVRIKRADSGVETVNQSELHITRWIQPNWQSYGKLLSARKSPADDDFLRFLFNTLLICGLSVIGQALSSSLVGWGFARGQFVAKNLLFTIMLATMMIPGQIGMIPTFMIYRRLGWIDTFFPLIVPAWFGSAFFSFLYRQFFMGIPLEMDEAAKVDGAGPLRTFWQILLPMARPVTVTVSVFTFLGAWNEFLAPLVYINSDHKRTLSLALAKFQSAYSTDIPAIMAGATLMLIPVLLIYFFSQRALVQGMVVSGVKG